MAEAQDRGPDTRCGFVALIGAPNAGKSTLANALTGAKVSIVTHKVQTTRARVRAIAIHGQSQIILVDTPGIFVPRRKLDRAMVDAAWAGAADADEVALLIDARKPDEDDTLRILDGLAGQNLAPLLIINKIDLVKRDTLLKITADLDARFKFSRIFMVSALTGDGIGDLKTHLADTMPPGPWLYPEDQIADLPLRQLAAEITREKLFLRLHDELPYASTVETESWQDKKDGSVRVQQVIYVERDSQKRIVLGKGGRTIKEIGSEARADLMKSLERPVHLFLFVKVREKWGEDPERFREMGLDYPTG